MLDLSQNTVKLFFPMIETFLRCLNQTHEDNIALSVRLTTVLLSRPSNKRWRILQLQLSVRHENAFWSLHITIPLLSILTTPWPVYGMHVLVHHFGTTSLNITVEFPLLVTLELLLQ